jgi:hypothetical protein
MNKSADENKIFNLCIFRSIRPPIHSLYECVLHKYYSKNLM